MPPTYLLGQFFKFFSLHATLSPFSLMPVFVDCSRDVEFSVVCNTAKPPQTEAASERKIGLIIIYFFIIMCALLSGCFETLLLNPDHTHF